LKEKAGRPIENEARDAELCRLRHEDKKRWSWERLARRFKMKTRGAAKKAYERHMAGLRGLVEARVREYTAVLVLGVRLKVFGLAPRADPSPESLAELRRVIIDDVTPSLEAAGGLSLLGELPA